MRSIDDQWLFLSFSLSISDLALLRLFNILLYCKMLLFFFLHYDSNHKSRATGKQAKLLLISLLCMLEHVCVWLLCVFDDEWPYELRKFLIAQRQIYDGWETRFQFLHFGINKEISLFVVCTLSCLKTQTNVHWKLLAQCICACQKNTEWKWYMGKTINNHFTRFISQCFWYLFSLNERIACARPRMNHKCNFIVFIFTHRIFFGRAGEWMCGCTSAEMWISVCLVSCFVRVYMMSTSFKNRPLTK